MKRRLTYILIYLIFVQSALSFAQIKPSITFTEDDGLAGNIVRDVIRDKDGILWVGTDFGLSKYNGADFKNIYKSDGLPSNKVWALAIDEKNTVYLGCYHGGLVIYENNSIKKILYTSGKYPNSYRKLHYSKFYKKLLVGTDYGLYILQDTVLIPVDFPKDSISKSSILSISEFKSRIFFTVHGGASNGLFELKIDPSNPAKSKTNFLTEKGRFASTILNDTIYYGEHNRIFKRPLNNIHNQYPISRIDTNFFIWDMKPYNDIELLFAGFDDGRFTGNFCIYNTATEKLSYNPFEIKANTVLNIFNDSISNTHWLCTDIGLTCLYDSPIENNSFEGIKNIIDIGFVGDSLLVLTEDFLYHFYKNTSMPLQTKYQIISKISMKFSNGRKELKNKFLGLFDASSGCSFAYFTKDGDKLFISTAKGAISVPDLKTYYPFAVGAFKTINNKSAYSNVMYIPLRYFPSIKDSIGYINPTCDKGKLTDVLKIIESKGVYYFATYYNGIYAIKDSRVYYLDNNNSVIDNFLTDIEKDGEGNVWCSSVNGNIFNIEFKDSLVIQRILSTSNSGIVGNTCKWIIFNNKYLFLGSNKGLNAISIKKLYSENPEFEYFYNEYNGFEFLSAKSPIKDKEGNIYIHTLNKIIKINANLPIYSKLSVIVRNANINNKNVTVESIDNAKLPYSTKKISFNFLAIKYPTTKNLNYNYKINNGDWIEDNQIDLQSLRAGNYEIKMDVFDKECNQHYSKIISFEINNPFWITWWFLLLSSLIIGAFVFLIVKIRISNLKKIHDERTKLIIRNSELKLRSLQLQMNPHFIFNSLNSIQSFIVTKSTKDAIMYLGNLAGIIRTNLENASEEYIHLSSEIEFLKKYVEIEKIRFKEKLKVTFNNNIEDYNILIPPMLIQPIIENSVKHGIMNLQGNGEINISFKIDADKLVITIEDNGVGREFTKEMNKSRHNSFGLNIIKQRLQLLNEKNHTDIYKINIIDLYNNGLPSGTKVIIQLFALSSC